MHTRKVI